MVAPACAAGGVSTVAYLSTGMFDAALALATWLVVYASYLIDATSERVGDDVVAASSRTCFVARYRPALRMLGTIALFAGVALSIARHGSLPALGWLVFPVAVAAYCLPWVGHLGGQRFGIRRIKDIPFAKTLYTALFWGLLGALAVVLCGASSCVVTLAGGFSLLFYRAVLNTAFSDLKDIQRDRREGVRTFATAWGRRKLLRVLSALDIAFAFTVAALAAVELVPIAALGLLATTLYYQVMLHAASRSDAHLERLTNLAADAEWILWPLYVAAAGWLT